jgi:prephenate dehydrogenase
MWTAIANENASALKDALSAVEARIGSIRSALATNDLESIRSYLEIAQQWFDGPARMRPQLPSTNSPV